MADLVTKKRWWHASHTGYVWLIVALVTLGSFARTERWNRADYLTYDSGGYYLYLSSKFITNDIGDASFIRKVRAASRPDLDSNYGIMTLPNGRIVFHYPIGLSFFYAPWFALAHTYARLSGGLADGYSTPYQLLVAFGCMLYSLWGLWLLGKELRRYFSDHLVALTILIIGIGTNLLVYSAYEPTMPHATLFFLNVLLLRSTRRWYTQGGWLAALAIAVVFGMMMLVRPSEIMMGAVPVLWGLTGRQAVQQRLNFWLGHWQQIVTMIFAVGLVGGIQLVFWRVVGGMWLIEFYPGQTFDFLHPSLLAGLFSVRKGWLFWTPLMAFALLGIGWLRRYAAPAFVLTVVLVPIFIYVTYSWWDWTYGGSFSSRPLISLYPLLSFSLASFWARWWPRWAWPLSLLLLVLVLLNMLQGWQYFLGMVHCCEENWENYRHYFFDLQWPNP